MNKEANKTEHDALFELMAIAINAIKSSSHSAESKKRMFEVLGKAKVPVIFIDSYRSKMMPLGHVFLEQFKDTGLKLTDCYKFYLVKEEDTYLLRENEVANDRVEHPSHYTWLKDLCGIEVIDITRHMDFDLGNAVKYLLRQGRKSEEGISDTDKAVEDLRKAVWYINDKIKMLEKTNNN